MTAKMNRLAAADGMTIGDIRRELEETIAKLTPFARPLVERLRELERLARTSGIGQVRRPIALCQKSIPPRGKLTAVTAIPQLPFTGSALWVDRRCAPFFDIVDLRVGRVSQGVSWGEIPATLFALNLGELALEDAERAAALTRWPIERCEPGVQISLEISNRDPEHARNFEAVMWGETEY